MGFRESNVFEKSIQKDTNAMLIESNKNAGLIPKWDPKILEDLTPYKCLVVNSSVGVIWVSRCSDFFTGYLRYRYFHLCVFSLSLLI